MRSYIFLFSLISFLNLSAQGFDDDISSFFNSVVFIEGEHAVMQDFNGRLYEVILRDLNTAQQILYTKVSTGSGILINTELDLYLVTAEHVARETLLNTTVGFSDKNGELVTIRLVDLIPDGKVNWVVHPLADVAVHQIDLLKLPSNIQISPIPFEIINTELKGDLRTRDLTVYGFPLGLGLHPKVSPISKTLKPASDILPLKRGDNMQDADFFLLDDPSISGFSGGPVLALPQQFNQYGKSMYVRVYRLMGLVHGSINDHLGGFAAIVPSLYIKEAIEKAPGFTGKHVYKYPNGNIWSECVFNSGFPWSVISNFDIQGNEQDKGSLTNGNGSLNRYDKEGKLIQKMEFKDGVLVKNEFFK